MSVHKKLYNIYISIVFESISNTTERNSMVSYNGSTIRQRESIHEKVAQKHHTAKHFRALENTKKGNTS